MSGPQRTAPESGVHLTADHRMLLEIRDTLYEGSWDDFLHDLKAKAQSRPRVFDTVPDSSRIKETIASHVTMIEQMRDWERQNGRAIQLEGDPQSAH
ncbi:MAG: hypothetical protein IIB59_00465 [Planctomycetes bacterium]|nr:hypothetical protein [Planctomycetota bacterium]